MIKVRITYTEDSKGIEDRDALIKYFDNDYKVCYVSKIYKGRGKSIYSNVYVDLEEKRGDKDE